MMAWLAVLVVFTLATFAEVNTQVPIEYDVHMFNCDRTGMDCAAGSTTTTCDNTKPTECLCSDNYEQVSIDVMHICLENPKVPCLDSDKKCENNGVCLQDGDGNDKCFCTPNYYGDDCSSPRVSLVCDETQMSVTVVPYGEFEGLMGTLNASFDQTLCTVQSGTAKTFPYVDTDGCGIVMSEDGSDTLFELELLILYNNFMVKKTDQLVDLICRFDADNNSVSVQVLDKLAPGDLNAGTVEAKASMVSVEVQKDTTLIPGPPFNFLVGNQIKFVFELTGQEADFIAMRLTSAIVKQSETAAGDQFVTIVNDGCVVENGLTSNNFDFFNSDVDEIEFTIEAFVFFPLKTEDSKNAIQFNFLFDMCKNPDDCVKKDVADCSNARRRRSAASDQVTVIRRIYVHMDNKTLDETISEKRQVDAADMDRCLKNPGLQAVVSVMGLLLFAFLLALIIVIFVVYRRSSRRGNKFMDGDRSTTSSTQNLDMQIPRPRV